jgi:hypothetical protein
MLSNNAELRARDCRLESFCNCGLNENSDRDFGCSSKSYTTFITNVYHRTNPNKIGDQGLFRRENKLKILNRDLSRHISVESLHTYVKAIQNY